MKKWVKADGLSKPSPFLVVYFNFEENMLIILKLIFVLRVKTNQRMGGCLQSRVTVNKSAEINIPDKTEPIG